ncbi:MAG: hypothetical protein J5J06_05165 [Phycisphaerae bacterium]|nr:hypothetical protein [Phycisphaerae bacterium]
MSAYLYGAGRLPLPSFNVTKQLAPAARHVGCGGEAILRRLVIYRAAFATRG